MTKIRELVDNIVDGKELRRQFDAIGSDESGPSEMAAVANVCLARGDEYAALDSALDLVWEKLNTGHWKSVEPGWRRLYGLVVIAKVRRVAEILDDERERSCGGRLIRDLVKMCDMGLLMGAPVMENACGRMASALSRLYASTFLTDGDTPSNPPKRPKIAPDIPFGRSSKIKVTRSTQ